MLTSTTAPGKFFSLRAELAEHYKSDWHKYNLKRREAGLPLLAEQDFLARWDAALALKREKDAKAKSDGQDHIKNPQKKKNKNKNDNGEKSVNESIAASQENPDINPYQSLFDSKIFDSLEENLVYMNQKYGFFLPDREHLTDVEGLLGYCHEKIKLGHYCLYCGKVFPTWQGCQNHMISTRHSKLRYEQEYWQELDPFYDFARDNEKFMVDDDQQDRQTSASDKMVVTDDDGDEDWEDVSDNGDDVDDDEDGDYRGYEKEIARFGLDITPLGELVFPDGRIVGHRALHKYYKQNIRSTATSDAVVAAKTAAGERVFEGKVVNINRLLRPETNGGSGKGILVAMKGGPEAFSALSLYRYRAAVRKQRRDDDKGRRLMYKTTQNINRMDKKANRLMNGVSVAHAAR